MKVHGIITPKVNKDLNGLKQIGLRWVRQGMADRFQAKSSKDICAA